MYHFKTLSVFLLQVNCQICQVRVILASTILSLQLRIPFFSIENTLDIKYGLGFMIFVAWDKGKEKKINK